MTDQSPDDNVYTCSVYLNLVNNKLHEWGLGYRTAQKVSRVASYSDVSHFDKKTDFSLTQTGYLNQKTMNKTSVSKWDDQNNGFLVTSYGFDPFGNQTSVTQSNAATTTTTYDSVYHTYKDVVTQPPNQQGVGSQTELRLRSRHRQSSGQRRPKRQHHDSGV